MKKVRSKLRPTEIGVIKTFSLSPDDEVGELAVECTGCTYYYNNLAELCEKWEDVPEEPKEWWYIDIHGPHKVTNNDEYYQQVKAASKEIGNYFSTKEEAEKAVEKLKAWKRLKDKGFRLKMWEWEFIYNDNISGELIIKAHIDDATDSDGKYTKDLDLLFGGEE